MLKTFENLLANMFYVFNVITYFLSPAKLGLFCNLPLPAVDSYPKSSASLKNFRDVWWHSWCLVSSPAQSQQWEKFETEAWESGELKNQSTESVCSESCWKSHMRLSFKLADQMGDLWWFPPLSRPHRKHLLFSLLALHCQQELD